MPGRPVAGSEPAARWADLTYRFDRLLVGRAVPFPVRIRRRSGQGLPPPEGLHLTPSGDDLDPLPGLEHPWTWGWSQRLH
jgi:hypothetical protein